MGEGKFKWTRTPYYITVSTHTPHPTERDAALTTPADTGVLHSRVPHQIAARYANGGHEAASWTNRTRLQGGTHNDRDIAYDTKSASFAVGLTTGAILVALLGCVLSQWCGFGYL